MRLQLTAGTELAPGDICSVKRTDSGFGVIKILAIEQHVVHIRKYKNRFAERPSEVDTRQLSLGTIHDPDGFGVGHLPMSAAGFSSWTPSRICRQEVTDEELEGYRYWLEDQGGNW